MALTYSEMIPLGSHAPHFSLMGTTNGSDNVQVSLEDFHGQKALLIIFMCNHCPYVKAINERLSALAAHYIPKGVGVVAINSNDSSRYPEDSFEHMKAQHKTFGFKFPYLVDETQKVAKAYDAVCTPDFFLFDSKHTLQYRGRMDDNWKEPEKVTKRDLEAALDAILTGKTPSPDQMPSMGCSIKWKS